MNPYNLFKEDTKGGFIPTNLWACSKCRFQHVKDIAEKCCKCLTCGKEADSNSHGVFTCLDCQKISRNNWEKTKFDKAQKVKYKDYGEDYFFFNDSYYETLEDLLDSQCEGDDPPDYAWASKYTAGPKLSLDRYLEEYDEEMGGDNNEFPSENLKGLEELKTAILKFNETNKDNKYYFPDESIAVIFEDDDFPK